MKAFRLLVNFEELPMRQTPMPRCGGVWAPGMGVLIFIDEGNIRCEVVS